MKRREAAASAGYGKALAARFRLDDAPSFVTHTLRHGKIAVTHIRCDIENNGLTEPFPREDALLLVLHLRACAEHDLWLDGQARPTGAIAPGMINIYDLRSNPIVNSISTFESLHFYLPFDVLNAISEAERGVGIGDPPAPDPGFAIAEPVIHGLGQSLLPAFARPDEANRLFVDHVTTAVASYVGSMLLGQTEPPGAAQSLTPWQKDAIVALLDRNLGGAVEVARLAEACDLPLQAFLASFERTFGEPPHRWLLRRRVARAQALLAAGDLTAAEIAAAAGFAGAEHLARSYAQIVGRPLRYSRH
jgi:AraC family transcriptional regulator